MPNLTVAEYDKHEQEAIAVLPNRIIEAFQPVHFYKAGYPSRISRESELVKYMEVMHELSFELDLKHTFSGKLTSPEFSLLQQMAERVNAFSRQRFGRNGIGRGTVIKSVNMLRHIKHLFKDKRPRVLEIGAGCGYLGAFLMQQGYPYASTDVAQAFYLYQNHFWNFISQGNLVELAGSANDGPALRAIPEGGSVHIPWWKFAQLKLQDVPEFDIVTCNHALCEMHPFSLAYTLKIAQAALSQKSSAESMKVFLFEGWGARDVASIAQVSKRFYKTGFVFVFLDAFFTALVPRESAYAVDCLKLPRQNNSWEPNVYATETNPVSKAVLLSRKVEEAERTVTLDEINAFYTGLLGSTDHLTPDEQFFKFILDDE